MDRHTRGCHDARQPFLSGRLQRYHIIDPRHVVVDVCDNYRVCDFPACLRAGATSDQEILTWSRRPAYQHHSSSLSADGRSLFGVSDHSMNGDRIEFSANDVAKLSFGRTSYGGIDELGHTHVCPGFDSGPRSLVVARTQ